MGHLFRAKDENCNLVYGSVVYGQSISQYLNGQWIKYEVQECK